MNALLLLALTLGQCGPVRLRVLTYGDSKTVVRNNGQYQDDNKDDWQDHLRMRLGCAITLNLGTAPTPGNRNGLSGSLARNGYTVADAAAIVDADLAATATPDVILFNLGSNDAFFGLPAEAAWKADLATIWDAMHAKWPAAEIIYSETWRENEGRWIIQHFRIRRDKPPDHGIIETRLQEIEP